MFKSAPVQLPPLRPKRPARPRKEQTKTHELLKHTRVEFSLRLAAEVELLRASTECERTECGGGELRNARRRTWLFLSKHSQ